MSTQRLLDLIEKKAPDWAKPADSEFLLLALIAERDRFKEQYERAEGIVSDPELEQLGPATYIQHQSRLLAENESDRDMLAQQNERAITTLQQVFLWLLEALEDTTGGPLPFHVGCSIEQSVAAIQTTLEATEDMP